VCPLTLLNVTSAKLYFTSWNYPSVSLRHDRVASSFEIKQIRYLENTPVKCYIGNFVCLRSCIKNVTSHSLDYEALRGPTFSNELATKNLETISPHKCCFLLIIVSFHQLHFISNC
jgi:hypothetical protein